MTRDLSGVIDWVTLWLWPVLIIPPVGVSERTLGSHFAALGQQRGSFLQNMRSTDSVLSTWQ